MGQALWYGALLYRPTKNLCPKMRHFAIFPILKENVFLYGETLKASTNQAKK